MGLGPENGNKLLKFYCNMIWPIFILLPDTDNMLKTYSQEVKKQSESQTDLHVRAQKTINVYDAEIKMLTHFRFNI